MSVGLGYIISDTRPSHSIQRVCDHKWMRSIRKKQLKQTQMGTSWVWPCETSGRQRHYHMRAVGASEYEATCGMPDSRRNGEGGETSESYLCLQ